MSNGSVYFIECAGRIKVGFSTDIKSRMSQLSTAAPSQLALIAKIEGSIQLERAIHKCLDVHRTNGEWFNDCGEVRTLISDLVTHGPTAISFVEENLPPSRQPSPLQAAITSLIKRKRPYGTKAWAMLSERLGIKERSAKHRLSNTRSYDIEELQIFLQGDDGLEYLEVIMGDKRPLWYAGFLATRGAVASSKAQGGRAGARR